MSSIRMVGSVFTALSGHRRRGFKYLGPLIEERKSRLADYGIDYPDKAVSKVMLMNFLSAYGLNDL